MTTGLAIFASFVAAFALISKWLSYTILTAPMIFIGLGIALSTSGLLPPENLEGGLHLVAEAALIVLLFLDAAQIDLGALRRDHVWSSRMLVAGLPLTIVFGTLAAWAFLPGWPLFALALVASILAPTDAALGQAVVTNEQVPANSRRTLIVESGLNDGLALPAVLLFASLAAQEMDRGNFDWLLFGAKQLILGPLIGAAAGYIGGVALIWAQKRNLTSEAYEGIGAVALAFSAYLVAVQVGGNGFIAAFVAGLFFGNVLKGRCKFVYEFTESEGQILTWGAFFLLGAALVPEALNHLTPQVLGLILLSLLVVRPVAIWLSLLGTRASGATRLFFGWFGPRGLATALFALLVLKDIGPELAEPVLHIAVNAVWISALLHGLTANPGARMYASWIAKLGDCAELDPVTRSAKPLPGTSLSSNSSKPE
jgi:NhaP-type Na+/H+ or K+/H+ antiporter